MLKRAERITENRICKDHTDLFGIATADIYGALASSMRYLIVGLLSVVLITAGCSDNADKPTAVDTTKQTSINNRNDDDKNDNLAPTVSISNVSKVYFAPQVISISATAYDNFGVHKVRFYDNDNYQGTDYSAPYTHNWSISATDNGTHLWHVKAYDASGNSNSDSVMLDVDITLPTDTEAPSIPIQPDNNITNSDMLNDEFMLPADIVAPNVSISPDANQTYTYAQTIKISAVASDNVGIARIEFYQDGILVVADTTRPYAVDWPISGNENGRHIWHAIAYDVAGNRATDYVMLYVNINPNSGR